MAVQHRGGGVGGTLLCVGCVVLWGLASDGYFAYEVVLASHLVIINADEGFIGIEVQLEFRWDLAKSIAVRPYVAVVITAILPALWLYRRIRHRTKPGHCVGCGYNLKGTMEAGRPAL